MHRVEHRIAWRVARNVLAFCVGVFIAGVFVMGSAHAETIAATYNANSQQSPARRYNVYTPSGWRQYTSWDAAGQALMAAWNCRPTQWAGGSGPTVYPPGRPLSEPSNINNWASGLYSECSSPAYGLTSAKVDSGWMCTGVAGAPGGTLEGGPPNPYYCRVAAYQCPTGQNWTLSGQSCTRSDCVAPSVRQANGTCSGNQVCYSLVVTPTGSCLKPSTCVPVIVPPAAWQSGSMGLSVKHRGLPDAE